MASVVYFIASHTNPQQIVRLVETLRAGSSTASIVIHHDYSKSYLDPAAFEGMHNIYIIEEYIPVQWGAFSLTEMTLHSFRWILNHLEFDWLVFISGQDYPIQPLSHIEQFLENTPYDGFMRGVALEDAIPCGPDECPIRKSPGKLCVDCVSRYYYQYYEFHNHHLPSRLKKELKRMGRFLYKIRSPVQIRLIPDRVEPRLAIGFRSFATPFTPEFKCYKGSGWFTLNHRGIQYIVQFANAHPRFVQYYRRTLIPDESFFHTIIFNHPGFRIFNDHKRFISWHNHIFPNPQVLGVQDFENLIASDQHFARKFDLNVDATVLDMLDEHINANRGR